MTRNNKKADYYHIMARGSGKQIIFEDDNDRLKFLKYLEEAKAKYGFELYAYCLMDNHFHLLIKDTNRNLSSIMHLIDSKYAMYYNYKYQRTGALFQGRFKSEPIYDDLYLKSVFRYIHRNPENAGIASVDAYPWSSYKAYLSSKMNELVDVSFMLDIFNGSHYIRKFLLEEDDVNPIDVEEDNAINCEDKLIELIKKQLAIPSISLIKAMDREKRNEAIHQLKKLGLTVKQMERLTGISQSTIKRILK